MADPVRVTLALPLSNEMVEAIRNADPSFEVTALSRAERFVYRDGRPLWAGYAEPPTPEGDVEGARVSLEPILQRTDVLLSNPIVPDNILSRSPNLKWVQ